jgi:hypothetical protein
MLHIRDSVRRCLLTGCVKCLEEENAIIGVESERLLIHSNCGSVSRGELAGEVAGDEGGLTSTGRAEDEEVVGGGRRGRRHDDRCCTTPEMRDRLTI